MPNFHVLSINTLSVCCRPMTLIADSECVSALLDHIQLPCQTRILADRMWGGDKVVHSTIYRMEQDDAVRMSCIVAERGKSRNMPLLDVFKLKKSLTAEMYKGEDPAFLVMLADEKTYAAAVAEIVRACPRYSKKTEASDLAEDIDIYVSCDDSQLERLQAVAEVLPQVAELVDMPTNELNTSEMSRIVIGIASKLGMKVDTIVGQDLEKRGFGGIYHVGKSGADEPRMLVLSYYADKPRKHVALVGKGIVYDTGGLCLKPREHMTGMKSDMGGAAAVFGAICMAAMTKMDCDVTAILCLAENGIGPNALRPDDIIRMYSGLTVEINNTDAEGRLVLSDGVSYASKHLNADIIMDVATLTGAQLICTGDHHAGILTPDEALERTLICAGKESGETVFPLLYAPELLMNEFKSEVADLKNSVKNRMNAQSSCAGHFVEKHLSKEYRGQYCHLDIAGPAWYGDRATGYGALLLDTAMRMI